MSLVKNAPRTATTIVVRSDAKNRASFYAMRNKLLGAGLIYINNKEYRLSGQFSKDLLDMARWWWTAMLNNSEETL